MRTHLASSLFPSMVKSAFDFTGNFATIDTPMSIGNDARENFRCIFASSSSSSSSFFAKRVSRPSRSLPTFEPARARDFRGVIGENGATSGCESRIVVRAVCTRRFFVTIFFFFFASYPSWCSLYAQNPFSRERTREQNEKKNTKRFLWRKTERLGESWRAMSVARISSYCSTLRVIHVKNVVGGARARKRDLSLFLFKVHLNWLASTISLFL